MFFADVLGAKAQGDAFERLFDEALQRALTFGWGHGVSVAKDHRDASADHRRALQTEESVELRESRIWLGEQGSQHSDTATRQRLLQLAFIQLGVVVVQDDQVVSLLIGLGGQLPGAAVAPVVKPALELQVIQRNEERNPQTMGKSAPQLVQTTGARRDHGRPVHGPTDHRRLELFPWQEGHLIRGHYRQGEVLKTVPWPLLLLELFDGARQSIQ